MRGLQTRCDFAAAKISLAIYPDADDPYAGMACAVTDAECLGYGDYQVGVHTVPTLFRDEPELVKAWERGSEAAADAVILAAVDATEHW